MPQLDSDLVAAMAATKVCERLGIEIYALAVAGPGETSCRYTRNQALQLIQVYTELLRITGAEASARAWVHAHNNDLGCTPAELLNANGLPKVLVYLQTSP